MGKPPVRDVKSNIRRGGKHPADLEVERADAKVNSSEPAVDESAQEAPKPVKPKRGKIAELTKQLEEANKRIKELETLKDEYSKSFFKRNQELAAAERLNKQLEADRNVTADNLRTSQNRIKELEDSNNVYINGAKSLVNRQKALREDYENIKKDKERLSKVNQDYRTQNSILTESIRQSALKSDKEVTQAQKELESTLEPKAEEVKTDNPEGDLSSSRDVEAELNEILKAIRDGRISDAQELADQAAKKYGDTSEPKIDNSAKTEEPVTPEGEAKVEGEPEVKTEQATQEPNSEAKQTSTESSEMTPEEVYDYLSDKNNFKEADTYFSSGKDGYVTKDNKRIPKSWFETFKENKDKDHSIQHKFFNKNNKDVFTASLRDKGLLEDLKKEPSREEVESTLAETEAKAKFDKWIDSKGNKFRGIIRKHPWISGSLLLSVGAPVIMKAINAFTDYGREQAIEDMQVPDEEFWGNSEDNEDFNGTDSDKVTEDLSNAAQETEQAGNNAEEQAAQALQENLPQDAPNAVNQDKNENPVIADVPKTIVPKEPTVNNTTGKNKNTGKLSDIVEGNATQAPVQANAANSDSGMTYDPNKPDMVTSQLIDAMGKAPQAGSDAIGYGDLYDQNFIDFWAKRNPNLAFGVSQGRR